MTRRYVVVDPHVAAMRNALRTAIERELRREAARAKRRRARHRKRRDARTLLNIVARLAIEQGGKCATPWCTTLLSESCTLDHAHPFVRGGSDKLGNLQLLCASCNSKKGTRTMDEWLAVIQAASSS
jgi:5-methylcytosine-specific restriction endonuclease McrA